jgi:hypothetical protein
MFPIELPGAIVCDDDGPVALITIHRRRSDAGMGVDPGEDEGVRTFSRNLERSNSVFRWHLFEVSYRQHLNRSFARFKPEAVLLHSIKQGRSRIVGY